ncbi:hypothetical protein N7517_009506 [Penicillium concentricum]|uniref:F-box domain-containing protein n=1 Tax=Penicillium concentricum TaxID=293559 RepID=A0A9W9RIR6_9EURO|nr:uncharacterized protein N7517_009506 [Penicillium concentricum]KAJ5360315.1 hypothetical protein N7517_009506 [Penicillium concentricum]
MPDTDAQTRALGTPEIVASILHQMDMRTLITAQGISRTWKDLICTTQSLQETLFLRPISHDLDLSTRVENPLLAEAFPSIFDNEEGDICLTDLTWEKNPAVREMFIRPEASWRRMLTHQPPLYRVGTFKSRCSPFGWSWSKKKASVPEGGLRMAPLFEFLIDRSWQAWAYGESIVASFPASLPGGLLRSNSSKSWNEEERDWKEMDGQFDLVLEISSSTTCTSEEDYEDGMKEMEEAREKGVVFPDTDLTVWKRICECYQELGLKMDGFKLEKFDEARGMWD